MTLSLVAVCAWIVISNIIAMFPSKRHHWPAAYVLMAAGVPLLAWVFCENGLWYGAVCLVLGAWILRWPVVYLWRWIKRKTARTPTGSP